MESLLHSLLGAKQVPDKITLQSLSLALSNSLVLGIILSWLTYHTGWKIKHIEKGVVSKKKDLKLIIEASNILFLCIGLTALMILVSDNLARALVMGAALSLIRFRVKLGKQNLGANVLFGIIAGIACGLHSYTLAWITSAIYFILQHILILMANHFEFDVFHRDEDSLEKE